MLAGTCFNCCARHLVGLSRVASLFRFQYYRGLFAILVAEGVDGVQLTVQLMWQVVEVVV